jgi:hypothetical protein
MSFSEKLHLTNCYFNELVILNARFHPNVIDTMVIEQSAWVLPTARIDTQKPNAKIGVGWCDFNCDGTLLASRNGMFVWSRRKPYERRNREP